MVCFFLRFVSLLLKNLREKHIQGLPFCELDARLEHMSTACKPYKWQPGTKKRRDGFCMSPVAARSTAQLGQGAGGFIPASVSISVLPAKNDDSGNDSILRVMAGAVMVLVLPAGGDYDKDVNDGDDEDGEEEGCSC